MLLGMSYLHVNKHHVTQLLHCSSIQIQPGFGGRHPLPLKISHSHWRTWIPTGVIHDSLVPSQPVPKWHLDWLSRFCTANGKASLHFTTGRPFPPLKMPLPMTGSGSNTWFIEPTQGHNSNGTSSSSFAGLTTVTDRQTDHATRSVTIGHI